jgi:hypothetical protein
MDNNFVIKLNDFLEKILNSIHFDNSDINYELNNLHNIFNEKVVSFLEEYTDRANEYYKQREEYSNKNVDPVNEKVKVIIKNIKSEYLKLFNEELTYSVASSYSAKMNLIGESDIDYFILFKPLTTDKLIKISQLLEKYNFKFQKIRNSDKVDIVYYVYDQVIDGIEVEVKVRDLMYSRSVIALHNYIDNKLDKDLKILLTYAKYQLKLKSKEDKSFKGYDLFKTIFYNYCFTDIDDAFYIII